MENVIKKWLSKQVKPTNEVNVYEPKVRVQSTVIPKEKLSYNEVMINVNKQLCSYDK